MVEINYSSFDKYISDLKKEKSKKQFFPVYLIYGEEVLYKTVLESLIQEMLPASQKKISYDPVEGTHENIPLALERVNTFSLLSETKVVALIDSKVFYTKQNENIRLEKAKDAYDQKDLNKAAGYFLGVLANLQVTLDDIRETNKSSILNLKSDEQEDDAWIDRLIEYCKDHQLTIPSEPDHTQLLEAAISRGFPPNNHLIITAEIIDKRRRLYHAIKEKGIIIDCSVPKGERRADKAAQEAVLDDRLKTMLSRGGKTMSRDARTALFEMTGFDLRTLSNNIEKLIHYSGDREAIGLGDVQSVLKRTKKDPIYELTNAVSDRHLENSLFYLNSLLSEDTHPLQALAAIANAVRKLLVVKSFTDGSAGQIWRADCPYNQFRSVVMPALIAHDQKLLDRLAVWEDPLPGLSKDSADKPAKKTGKRKKRPVTDLLMAKNPNNPYPIYQTFKKSGRYTTSDLIDALGYLADADQRLKTTSQDPKLILENMIVRICGIRETG